MSTKNDLTKEKSYNGRNKVKFTKDFLRDRLGDRKTTVLDEIIDQSRWSTLHRQVFKHEDKLFETVYSHGSTEQQDESPYENDDDEIDCPEVFAVQKMVTVYEQKPSE